MSRAPRTIEVVVIQTSEVASEAAMDDRLATLDLEVVGEVAGQ